MRDHHALWCSGGAGGVDDVGGVLRGEAAAGRRGGMARDDVGVGVEAKHVAAVGGSRARRCACVTSTGAHASESMKPRRSRG